VEARGISICCNALARGLDPAKGHEKHCRCLPSFIPAIKMQDVNKRIHKNTHTDTDRCTDIGKKRRGERERRGEGEACDTHQTHEDARLEGITTRNLAAIPSSWKVLNSFTNSLTSPTLLAPRALVDWNFCGDGVGAASEGGGVEDMTGKGDREESWGGYGNAQYSDAEEAAQEVMNHKTCVLQCVAVCCSALQCVAVRCSALQCVAV